MAKTKTKVPKGVVALPQGTLRLRKNPATFALEHPVPSGDYVRILGMDLGRNCGIAICDLNRDKSVHEQLIAAFASGDLEKVKS